MMRIALFAVLSLIVATVGCRRGGPSGDVPDEATFYLQGPEDDDGGSTASQAVCTDGSAHDALAERIALYNDAVQARIGLIKLMIKAGERAGANGEVTKTVTKNGFTVVLDVVNDGSGTVAYTVTLTDAQGTATKLLTGTAKDDLSEGAWDFQGLTQNRAVHVTWTNADGTLTVDRDATGDFGERTAHYVRTDTEVTLTFAGPNADANAEWDRTTKSGSITINGVETCWQADPAGGDGFCNVDCGAGEGEGEGGQ